MGGGAGKPFEPYPPPAEWKGGKGDKSLGPGGQIWEWGGGGKGKSGGKSGGGKKGGGGKKSGRGK